MTSPEINDLNRDTINRKKFLLGAGATVGAATLFGSAPKAYATDTNYAYWDAAQTFTADQYFGNVSIVSGLSTGTGQVYFKSGQPWVDVKAFGAVGNGSSSSPHDDTSAINSAFAAAITISGIYGTYDDPIIYFPPGDYLITSSLVLPDNASDFCIMGAGYESSRLVWGGTVVGQAMLPLLDPFQVHIKDIGFVVSTTLPGVVMPQYAIQCRATTGMSPSGPQQMFVERVFIGSTTGSSAVIDTAISFSADASSSDKDNSEGTFRDVSIQYVNTGYRFGMENAVNHNIIGGSVQNCQTAAIDNTPYPTSAAGGSCSVYGTRFAGNVLTLQIVQSSGNEINLIGIHAGTSANPEGMLLKTPTTGMQNQPINFIGGNAILSDPVGSLGSVYYNDSQGPLEFHGFRLWSPTGVALNFPGTGVVSFFGGKFQTKSCAYNGPLLYHGTMEGIAAPVYTPTASSYTANLVQLGYNNHLVGSNAYPGVAGTNYLYGPAFYTSTITVTNGGMGGQLSVQTPATGGPFNSTIIAVSGRDSFPGNAQAMLSAANANAAGVMNGIFSGTLYNNINSTATIYINLGPGVALAAGKTYVWNFMMIG